MIQHVTLETRRQDVEDAVAFWALLGFERVEPPGRLATIAVWVQRAGTQVHLLFDDDPVAPARGHTAVVADDYDEAVARASSAGRRPRTGAARAASSPRRAGTASR